jgi:hypothetical protein
MKNYDNLPEEVSPTTAQAICEECMENNIEPVFDQKKFELYREFLTKIRGLRTKQNRSEDQNYEIFQIRKLADPRLAK